MMKTEKFREQHVEILELANKISDLLNADQLRKDSSEMFKLVSRFTATVKLHLVMEDDVLYPLLREHKDLDIRSLAQKYIYEHGGARYNIIEYAAKWTKIFAIQQNPEGFIKDTKNIFDLLKKRIDKEDNELFPIVDKTE